MGIEPQAVAVSPYGWLMTHYGWLAGLSHGGVSYGGLRRLTADWRIIYSVSQKNIPPEFFLTFFPNGSEFLVQILHAYYTFLSTLDYKFLFSYLQL